MEKEQLPLSLSQVLRRWRRRRCRGGRILELDIHRRVLESRRAAAASAGRHRVPDSTASGGIWSCVHGLQNAGSAPVRGGKISFRTSGGRQRTNQRRSELGSNKESFTGTAAARRFRSLIY